MRRLITMCLFLVTCAATSIAGDVQVFCEPGLRVYLDDTFVGTSSDKEDGLFLANVANGTRMIRVEKDGFVAQNIRIEVSDYPVEVKVGRLSPEPQISYKQEAEPQVVRQVFGNLMITSAPQNCVVEIDGKATAKNSPQLAIGRIDAGDHTISFSKPGYETVSEVVTIHPGTEVTVRGDLINGKVQVLLQGRGSLRLISTPQRCTVRFRGQIEEKTHPHLNLTHIPAGEYPIVVEIKGRKLSRKVVILDGQRAVITVSFVKGEEPFSVSYVPN